MIAYLAALVLQQKEQGPIVVPPGTSAGLQATIYGAQAAVDAKDWTGAKRLADRLPDFDLTVEWDDSALSPEQKLSFAKARDDAFTAWMTAQPKLKITLAKKGDLKFSFVKDLPPNVDSPGPAGAVYFDSPAEGEPRVEAVIALARGKDARPTALVDVVNEAQYAIGAALGLARMPRPGTVMFRSEEPYTTRNPVKDYDARLVLNLVTMSDLVRKTVSEKKDPKIGLPKLFINPITFTHEPVGQAEEMGFTLQVTNQGKSVLQYSLVPDCGCFLIGRYQPVLKPGETTVVEVYINTYEFTGKLHKVLFLYSNDPEAPIKQIPLEATVRPAYRFVNLTEGPILYLDDAGTKFETLLVVDDSQDFNIKKVSATGMNAAVDYEPWKGTLDWPELGEGKKERKGYLIRALVSATAPPGRVPMQIQVETDSKTFPTLTQTINVQKGIVAMPLSVYFGQLTNQTAKAGVILSRPGRPYKVTKVESDTEFVKASFEEVRDQTDYRIIAEYTGKAPPGRFYGKITVYTDDPKQPTIAIQVEGNVR